MLNCRTLNLFFVTGALLIDIFGGAFSARSRSTSDIERNIGLSLERKVTGTGFHRDIETTLVIEERMKQWYTKHKCEMFLFEILPSGVYADPFQLKSLQSFGGPEVQFDGSVDIEAPAFLAKPHELFVFIHASDADVKENGDSILKIKFPIHIRYHQPSSDPMVTHTDVIILHPGLYSNCSMEGSADTLNAPCRLDGSTECLWYHTPYVTQSPIAKLKVPIGRHKDKPLVVILTLLISVTVCAILIKVLVTH